MVTSRPVGIDSQIPSFTQWECRERIAEFVKDPQKASTDSHWVKSGAKTLEEYVEWAPHLCGAACLKMLICAHKSIHIPLFDIKDGLLRYGGYQIDSGKIKGLFYKQALEYLSEVHALQGSLEQNISELRVAEFLKKGGVLIASVHPSIRYPQGDYDGKKGGHLILAHHCDDTQIVVHNPSGFEPGTQENAKIPLETFARYFAGRGMLFSK